METNTNYREKNRIRQGQMSFWIRSLWKLAAILIVLWMIMHLLTGCGSTEQVAAENTEQVAAENKEQKTIDWSELHPFGSMELVYAKQFSVDFLSTGTMSPNSPEEAYALVKVADTYLYLVVPENLPVPENTDPEIVVIQKPLEQIYLAASAVMDMYLQLDALDQIAMTGTTKEDFSSTLIQDKMEAGEILYGGKYSAPDYEMILEKGVDLAIESTMIFHKPEIKEELESLGIPVFVDYESYESHPLGRVEWVRLYGLLAGRYDEAKAFMEDCQSRYEWVEADVEALNRKESDCPKVAFFYINSQSGANVRKPGDYISKMIDMAGGKYLFEDLKLEDENAMSTVNMDLEAFYEKAVDADILIYNSTVEGEIETLDQLLEKCPLLADCKAVKSGHVWCTGKNMYQEPTGTIQMIEDFYSVTNEKEADELSYLHPLR